MKEGKVGSARQTEKKEKELTMFHITHCPRCNIRVEVECGKMNPIYKCADCGSYEIIEGSEKDCEETYKEDSGSEKELSKHENGLNHMHGINSETSDSDSKEPEPKCDECGEPLVMSCSNCGIKFWEIEVKKPEPRETEIKHDGITTRVKLK